LLRKIVAVFLALATIVMLFTACDGNDNPTTTEPISTGNISTTETTKPEPATYVLTTNQSKTVPWQETTRFETTAPDYNAITFPTDNIDVPPVNIIPTTGSSLPITVPTAPTNPTTSPSTMSNPLLSNTSASSTTKTTATTTKPAERFPTALIIDSEGYNASNGKLYLGVSTSGWSSDIKAATTSINIKIDGVSVAKKVSCSVTAAKNSDGMQEIVIDLSAQSVSSGSSVTYTIPEGFLVSKSGTQYNTSYTSSATI
jgi:hypothetical protein